MTASRATDEARIDTFQAFISAANRYVTELDSIADQASDLEPGTAEMVRAFAERQAWLALDLVGLWPTEGGADHRR